MDALTVWQPWASLIAIGAKPYEFRGWPAPKRIVGKRIAVHAGARPVRIVEVDELIAALLGYVARPPCLQADVALPFLQKVRNGLGDKLSKAPQLFGDAPAPFTLPLSAVVCTAIVGAPMRGDECAREFGVEAGNNSARDGTFNWGWPMRDVQPCVPAIEARGAQGLWHWSGGKGLAA